MNFRHLKIFLTVCEAENMTRAAKSLHLAQPSVSQAIAELETYYGVHLFDRLNHRLYLTTAGERLRSYASHILNLSEQARQELADLERGGSLRVGASLTIGAYILPGLMALLKVQHPDVEVYMRVDNTSLIEKLLLEDHLDLGLVEGPVYSPHILEEPFCDDHLVCIAAPHHVLARQTIIRVQDLWDQTFLVREPGSGTQDIFEHAMQVAGIRWKTAGVYNNNEALKQAVIANMGLGVVSKIAVKEELRRGCLVGFDVEGLYLKRKFNLVYHRQKFFTRAMQAFRDLSKVFVEWQDGKDEQQNKLFP